MDQLREDRIRAMQSLREDPSHDVNSISFRTGGASLSADHESDLRGYVASIPDGGGGAGTRKRKRTASDGKRKTPAASAASTEKTKRRRMIIDKIDGSANLLDDRINETASHTSDAARSGWIEQKSQKSKLILGSPHLAKIRLRDTRNSRIKRWQVNVSHGCGRGRNDRWKNFLGLTRLLQRRYFSADESYDRHNHHNDEDDFDDVFVPQEDLIRVGGMELVGGAPERPESVRLASSGEVVRTPTSSRRGFCSGWGIEHGKRVHEEVERMVLSYAEHGTVEPGITSMRREPDLCSLRFMKFMMDNNWRPLTCEYKMYHPLLGVATAADVVALDVVTLNIVFIELKTGGTTENFRSARHTRNESTGEMKKRMMRAELDTVDDTPLNRAVVQCLVMMMMMQSNAEIMIANGAPVTSETIPIPDEFYVVHVPSGREKPERYKMPSWVYKPANRQLVFNGLRGEIQQQSVESVYRGTGARWSAQATGAEDEEGGECDEDARDVARSGDESPEMVSSPQSETFSHDSLSDTSDSSDDDDAEESVLRILAF